MREIARWQNSYDVHSLDDIFTVGEDERHFIFDIVEELSANKSDNLIIWGTYANALKCFRFLKQCDIHAKACVVNEKYLNLSVNKTDVSDEFPLVSLEDYLNDNDNVDIIIDFSFYKSEMLREYSAKVRRVFVGDVMGVFILDEPYIIKKDDISLRKEDIKRVYDSLADELSRREYIDFISQKIWGFYNKTYHDDQYFDSDIIAFGEKESYVDAGAFDGDSILKFTELAGNYDSVYGFEMDPGNYLRLKDNCEELDRCFLHNKGVGEKKKILKACFGMNSASHISEQGNIDVEIDSLDSILGDIPVTFIKMDIEGAEYDALKGAKHIIEKNRPKLAVCAYHKLEDLWKIPGIIQEYNPGYRLLFRNYHNSASESVFYALAK